MIEYDFELLMNVSWNKISSIEETSSCCETAMI